MKKGSINSLTAQERKSPGGKYHLFRKNLSEAIGGKKDTGAWGGGHPFDVEWYRLPPGAVNFPHHAHAAQWEMYLFVSGSGQVRGPEETCEVTEGDFLMFPPNEAHSVINTGKEDLVFYVIADQPRADVISYPDTGKWVVKPPLRCFRMEDADYYEKGD